MTFPDIPANERMCPFCKHLDTNLSVVYDEYDSNSYSIVCEKGRFYLSEPDKMELASRFIYARDCEYFEASI